MGILIQIRIGHQLQSIVMYAHLIFNQVFLVFRMYAFKRLSGSGSEKIYISMGPAQVMNGMIFFIV